MSSLCSPSFPPSPSVLLFSMSFVPGNSRPAKCLIGILRVLAGSRGGASENETECEIDGEQDRSRFRAQYPMMEADKLFFSSLSDVQRNWHARCVLFHMEIPKRESEREVRDGG